jgi:hypothetical protein
MLRPNLQKVWDEATEEQRHRALTEARVTLANLVNYKTPRGVGAQPLYTVDIQYVAAQLLAFSKGE